MVTSVALVVYTRFGFLDVIGPADVFTFANQLAGRDLYRPTVVASRRGDVTAESGLRLGVDETLASVDQPHTLLISGGDGVMTLIDDASAMAHIERLADGAERVVSVCTGAFVLAELGLLNERSATTHWAWADDLAARHPQVDVVSDELFVRAGHIVTAAGVAAGIDVALAIVADDHGPELARAVSRRMVLYLQRSGGQSQFSERAAHVDVASGDVLDEILAEIADHPRGAFTNAALAERVAVSERHLVRMFRKRTGTTPAQWVARVRIDHARQHLEHSEASLAEIATLVGFGSVDTMRQVFHRVLGMSPQEYRRAHGKLTA